MKISKHAIIRMSQRGIPKKVILLIFRFGATQPSKKGVRKFIRKRDINWITYEASEDKQILDKAMRRTLVMSVDESSIITAY